jgi:hypothetical protein
LRSFVDRFGMVNTYNLAFVKLPKFRDEQEIRLVHQHEGDGAPPLFVRLPIDLTLLRPTVMARPEHLAAVNQLLADAGLHRVLVRAREAGSV